MCSWSSDCCLVWNTGVNDTTLLQVAGMVLSAAALLHISSNNFNPLCQYIGCNDTQFNATFSAAVSFISLNETRK
jgi:hypothetical protein